MFLCYGRVGLSRGRICSIFVTVFIRGRFLCPLCLGAWREFVVGGGDLPMFFIKLLVYKYRVGRMVGRCGMIPLPIAVDRRRKHFCLGDSIPVIIGTSRRIGRVTSNLSAALLSVTNLGLGPASRLRRGMPSVIFSDVPKVRGRTCGLSIAPRLVGVATSTPGNFCCKLRALCRLLPISICYGRETHGTR